MRPATTPGATALRFRKSSAVQSDSIDANAVVMNLATMNCFLLNDMAAVLWEALDHFQERTELVGLLESAGIADPADVFDRFAAELLAAGLLDADPA